ncbi:MAG: efflux RND transporter periplasmic adaptor subunit [Candidatus Latescibacteria bacterium]|jgi:HlyD family secretion protein|nr:efflux RND transporter periplasmic adaptor subunit [Candidatus Latescibacterota bacterium]
MSPSFPQITKTLKNRYVLYPSITVFIILFVIIYFFIFGSSTDDEENWANVQQGEFIIDLVESGEIQAVNSMFVRAPREWRMDLQIIDMVPEGTIIKEGDFLVQFDTSTLDEELDKAIDKMKQAEADLKSIETQQASRMSKLERGIQIAIYSREAAELKVELLRFESVNIQEDARLNLQKELIRFKENEKNIKTQKIIDIAEWQKSSFRLEQAKSEVEHIKKRIDQLTLRAPISGMVVYNEVGGWNAPRYKASIGDKVRSGENVISIPDLSKIKMVVKVNEMDAGYLKKGQKAQLRLDAFDESIYHGSVSKVASLVEKSRQYWQSSAKAPSFQVTIMIDEQDKKLKPGMTAQATIVLEKIPDAFFVPVGAIFELDDGSSVVYTRKSFPNTVPVKLGKQNDRFITIIEGLGEKDEVSLFAPTEEVHPLGWFVEMERLRTEFQEFLTHIETMNERGLTYNPAQQDSIKKAQKLSSDMPAGNKEIQQKTSESAATGAKVIKSESRTTVQ